MSSNNLLTAIKNPSYKTLRCHLNSREVVSCDCDKCAAKIPKISPKKRRRKTEFSSKSEQWLPEQEKSRPQSVGHLQQQNKQQWEFLKRSRTPQKCQENGNLWWESKDLVIVLRNWQNFSTGRRLLTKYSSRIMQLPHFLCYYIMAMLV